MVAQVLQYAEPIAGYKLTEQIGSGGYGVVWKADAPGGLSKAIKFVYGQLDDARAAREMKALGRIKQVRHPFLLSLERIEVVDGQLIIVTELADMCLMDRFKQCAAEGLPGIPRDELLAYLGDAADALDYMSEHFSLQHLDVKPENLLLVGGRIKVGDFGLIKDLHELSASVMGGFTPLYAPPEAFDGRASRHSDQYSLAIVYQEMLTGILPFPGKTAAQLTAQHLNSKPLLSPAPLHDRPVLARALEKDPERRFSSCRELVDRLRAAEGSSGSDNAAVGFPGASADSTSREREPAPRDSRSSDGQSYKAAAPSDAANPSDSHLTQPASPSRPSDVDSKTQIAPRAPAVDADQESLESNPFKTQVAGRGSQPAQAPARRKQKLPDLPPVEELPPVDLSEAKAALRPTLFLGVGETGARILGHLRRRLCDRFDLPAGVLPLRMLLLDTDLKALHQATQGDDHSQFQARETVGLPLRRPQDYRGEAKRFLRWLSRRWLYNIPRALQTEGLRPLGRLAFADHAAEVFERLREELTALTDPELLETSSKQSGLPLAGAVPRVVLVASISGGTGSGIVLDLAYAVRQMLVEGGQPRDGVGLLLVHSTSGPQGAKVIASANAYACLSELFHYSREGGSYPGDPTCSLEPCQGRAAQFPETYVVDLGENLSDAAFDAATGRLADYLYLDTVTAAGAFFERCREETRTSTDTPRAGVPLRTFGIWQPNDAGERILSHETDKLCRHVVDRWRSQPETREPLSDDDAAPPGDSYESIRQGERNTENFARQQVERLGLNVDWVKAQLAAPRPPSDDLPDGDSAAPGLGEWILELVELPDVRLGGALRAANWLRDHLKRLQSEVSRLRETAQTRLVNLEKSLWEEPAPSRKRAPRRKERGANTRRPHADPELPSDRDELKRRVRMLENFRERVRAASGEMVRLCDELTEMRRELTEVADSFTGQHTAQCPDDVDETLTRAVHTAIRSRTAELAEEVDRRIRTGLLDQHGGLHGLLTVPSDLRRTWPMTLRAVARRVLYEALGEVDVAETLLALYGNPEELRESLRRDLSAAEPRLNDLTAARRLLLVVPNGTAGDQLVRTVTEDLGRQPSRLPGASGEVLFCYEADGLSLPRLGCRLAADGQDCEFVARRVHTRCDVDWAPLDEGV